MFDQLQIFSFLFMCNRLQNTKRLSRASYSHSMAVLSIYRQRTAVEESENNIENEFNVVT